jgi:hypothetical protein
MQLLDKVSDIDYSLLDSDDSLFHYARVKTALEGIFESKKVKLGTFSNTNDPLEYNKRFLAIQKQINSNQQVTEKGWEVKKLLEQIMLKNTYFLSTCKNSYKKNKISNCGYLKSRMWSQYGDNHEGFCFVFSKAKLVSEIESRYPNKEYYIRNKNITYYSSIDSLYETTVIDADKIGNKVITNYSISYIREHSNKLFFMKQDDYRDENEYRFIVIDKKIRNGIDVVIPLENILKAVIVGDKFNKAYNPCLEQICVSMNTAILKLKWYSNRFLLEKIF